MLINLNKNNFNIEVDLPLSKSESNRALMIAFYSGTHGLGDLESRRLSTSDDTILLHNLLCKINQYVKNYKQSQLSVDSCPLTLDCANAGTVFRFLMTAVASLQLTINNLQLPVETQRLGDLVTRRLEFFLNGSERMKQRPIDSLVEALRSLGVSVEYAEKEGYPPVLIKSSTNHTNYHQSSPTQECPRDTWRYFNPAQWRLEISVEKSSQFASSLLLAAPLWKNGLELQLTGNLTSLPYIDMTVTMMRQCGIDVERKDRTITVKPGRYKIDNLKIEPDWSAAAFWYEIAALSEDSNILLKNLNINSLQADAMAIKMFDILGVETLPYEDGVIIIKTKGKRQKTKETFDFTNCPDLFPAVISACAGLCVNATFSGLKNLSIKESDRRKAMMNELKKINISFEEISDDELKMQCPDELPCFTEENPIIFNNYNDHRIAMALSILSIKIGAISMENPEVVSKSYPDFFEAIDTLFKSEKLKN